jgi:coenzyme PQQ synthesis protein D (PqqD)
VIAVALLRLADHAVFDDIDGAGVILDTRQGVYLSLNSVATLMLHAGLRFSTLDEAIGYLRERIDAPDETLDAGIRALSAQLDEHTLLSSGQEEPR